jgi:hypothetical protein
MVTFSLAAGEEDNSNVNEHVSFKIYFLYIEYVSSHEGAALTSFFYISTNFFFNAACAFDILEQIDPNPEY